MTQIPDDKLLNYNHKGLLPGPVESEEEFLRRADYCLHLQEILVEKLPFSTEDAGASSVLTAGVAETSRRYDCAPEWVQVFFSNYQLMPWHGGCAWIFQLSIAEPTAAFFQLRKAFRDHRVYLGMYDRDELIAHELVHVGRMMFEEPVYEEMLAYRTSKSAWKRWSGPLVRSSAESAWFVFLLMPIIFLDLYLLFNGYESYYWKMMWLKLLPCAIVIAGVVRLMRRHRTFERSLTNLKGCVGDNAEAVIYRLTDLEIDAFAEMSPEDIHKYAAADRSLRWRVIRLAYLKPDLRP